MSNTPTILKKIIARKYEEIAARKDTLSLANLTAQVEDSLPVRGFEQALRRCLVADMPGVIAEIKKASPSKGVICQNFQPARIAKSYAEHGAACLSVLTDVDFFQGHDTYLQEARAAVDLPVIRKDFIVDPYQVIESKVLGADCILLIAAVLDKSELEDLTGLAQQLKLDVLVEVHNAEELEQALHLPTSLLGINNRDLHSFEVSLETTYSLLSSIPESKMVITESGIHTLNDVAAMRSRGVNGFLVGEAFMREDDPGKKLQDMFFSD